MRKNTVSEVLKNKKMDNAVYLERRKVIEIIYALKKVVPALPRIEVRITEGSVKNKLGAILGQARLSDLVIWIPAATLSREYLYQVVAHEVVHAVTGFRHNEKCPLMCSVVGKTLSTTETNKLFIKYLKGC